jgi:ribosomal protein L9
MTQETITPELAIIQYKEILVKSEIVPEIDVTELASLAKRASDVIVTDITNAAQMQLAKTMRTELSKARIEISKNAKSARDVFTKINRGISSVEDVLLAEFEGEENRLKGYETELKDKRLRDERVLSLPVRKERLASINVTATDGELLAMDELAFSNFLVEKQTAILAEKKRQEEEEAKLKAAAEQAKADAEKLAKQKAYQQFLADNKHSEITDILNVDDGTVKLYRLIATYLK